MWCSAILHFFALINFSPGMPSSWIDLLIVFSPPQLLFLVTSWSCQQTPPS